MASALTAVQADTGASRRIEVAPGETLAVHESGQGPPVVIVPGLLGSAFGFRHVVPQLVEVGVRVIVIDPLGTGESTRPNRADYSLTAQASRIAEALDSMHIRRAVFVCHAVSASICYRLALERPRLAAGIVSINGGPAEAAGTPGMRTALRFAPLLRLFGGRGMARGKVRGGLKDSSADPAWVTEDVVDGYVAPFDDLGDVLDMLKAMNSSKEPEPITPRLDDLLMPVYLMVGASPTSSIRADEIVALATSVREIELDSVPDAGQYIHEESADIVAAAIMRMIVLTMPEPALTSARRGEPRITRVPLQK